MKKTRHEYEIFLDEIGVPENDKKSNGGRISDSSNYGGWLRMHDPIAFEVGYSDWKNNY